MHCGIQSNSLSQVLQHTKQPQLVSVQILETWASQFHQNTRTLTHLTGVSPAQKILTQKLRSQWAPKGMTSVSHAAVWLPVLHPQITALLCLVILMHPRN
jgi:hypothetical protein